MKFRQVGAELFPEGVRADTMTLLLFAVS